MALTPVLIPRIIFPVLNPEYFMLSSDNSNTSGFKYRFNFFITNIFGTFSNTPDLRLSILPNPSNQIGYLDKHGQMDIMTILQDYRDVSIPNYSYSSNTSLLVDDNSIKKYYIRVDETAPTVLTASYSLTHSYFVNGYLDNNQFYNFDLDKFYLKNNCASQSQVQFLTNRPNVSRYAGVNDFPIINITTTQSNVVNSTASSFERVFFRRSSNQPLFFDTDWYIEQNSGVGADNLDSDDWTTSILSINGQWIKSEDEYFTFTQSLPDFRGSFNRFRKGTTFQNFGFMLEFSFYPGSGPTFIGSTVPIYGLRNDNVWEVVASDRSSLSRLGDIYTFRYNTITLNNDYQELGLKFNNVGSQGSLYIQEIGFNFTPETPTTTPITMTTYGRSIWAFHYNSFNELIRVDQQPLGTSSNSVMDKIRSLSFKSDYINNFDIERTDVFVSYNYDDYNTALLNKLTETLTLKGNKICKWNMDIRTIIWHNALGGFDSYDFIKLSTEVAAEKSLYNQPRKWTYNISTTQNKMINANIKDTITITTDNVNKETSKWLSEIISSDYVFEWNGEDLIPITILTNRVVEKPINNIYSQIQMQYNYSQKQFSR